MMNNNSSMPRNYCNGIDHVTRSLDFTCRKTPGRGNHFLLVLEPCRALRTEELNFDLSPYLALLHGRIQRDLRLAPYWQPGKPQPINLNTDCDDLEGFANTPLAGGAQLNYALINGKLAFKFGHLLFDGRGAEMFLRAIFKGDLVGGGSLPDANLRQWQAQFAAGKTVNRYLIALRQRGKVADFGATAINSAAARHCLLTLDATDTAQIKRRAETIAGPFMLGVYMTAQLAAALNILQKQRNLPGGLMLPVSTDLRGISVPPTAAFFNQWSVSPVFLTPDEVGAAETVRIETVKRQFIANTASRLPQALREANLLTRIVPRRLMPKLLNSLSGSAMTALLPDCLLTATELATVPLFNLYHWPLMPPRPGIGIFFNIFNGMMNIVISWREGTISRDEAIELSGILQSLLKYGDDTME